MQVCWRVTSCRNGLDGGMLGTVADMKLELMQVSVCLAAALKFGMQPWIDYARNAARTVLSVAYGSLL